MEPVKVAKINMKKKVVVYKKLNSLEETQVELSESIINEKVAKINMKVKGAAPKKVNSLEETQVKLSESIINEYDCLPICASIRSIREPQFQCLMRVKNSNKYCPMHLSQTRIIDYKHNLHDMDHDNNIINKEPKITNLIIRKINLDNDNINKVVENDANHNSVVKSKTTPEHKTTREHKTLHEHKMSTILNTFKENEEELEIKLLILVNEDSNKFSELIGPVFNDITLSEDALDPITYDEFWTIQNGVKKPANINKYYLFSYVDTSNKIRCLSVFTLYNLIKNNSLEHPNTMEKIPQKDIDRAKKLIELYDTCVGLFNDNESNLSPEFKLKNRITKLFNQFHIHSIYFEESWLLDLDSCDKLDKIIKETRQLVSNNLKSINPNINGFSIFNKKSSLISKVSKDVEDELLNIKEYIVIEWEKLIQASDTPQNQIPIWIIASGLSFVTSKVKEKYPELEIML